MSLTRQEMFNKAYRGLASQNWAKCEIRIKAGPDTWCIYTDENGRHCAWGWVDPSLPVNRYAGMTVRDLRVQQIGVAADIDVRDLMFTENLQVAHDSASGPDDMRRKMELLAEQYYLDIPQETV